MSNKDAPNTADNRPAVGGPVERPVRPRAWHNATLNDYISDEALTRLRIADPSALAGYDVSLWGETEVVFADKTTFLRCDEMRVTQQRPGLISVEWVRLGAVMYTMHVDCDLAAGQTLTLAGIEVHVALRAL